MSEYQYYEFRAIDRPLDRKEMDELRALSTRAEITPTSFTNTYHWGDFKGKPVHPDGPLLRRVRLRRQLGHAPADAPDPPEVPRRRYGRGVLRRGGRLAHGQEGARGARILVRGRVGRRVDRGGALDALAGLDPRRADARRPPGALPGLARLVPRARLG